MSSGVSKLNTKRLRRWWQVLLIAFLIIIVLCFAAVVLFASPLTKYLTEKYDLKYIGRQIKIDRVQVNPFKGSIHLTNLRIHEQNGDSIFISVKALSADISMTKLLTKTFQLNSLTLDQPRAAIVQHKKRFNFSDLIKQFTHEKGHGSTKASFNFNLLNVTINDGEVFYTEQLIPVNYSIRNLKMKSAGKYWNQDTINIRFSFLPGHGSGDASGNVMLNLKNLDYRFSIVTHKFDMSIIEQYLKEFAAHSNFSANMDMDVHAKGNLKNKARIMVKGIIAINDLHFGNGSHQDYASFQKFTVGIKQLDSQNKKYFFDSVTITRPYFKLERYDYLDNIQRLVGVNGANIKAVAGNPERFNLIIETVRYLKIIFKQFLKSDYSINRLLLQEGVFQFNDYAINEKFSAALDPVSLQADSVSSSEKWVKGSLTARIKPFGYVSATASMNPKNNKDFNLAFRLRNVPAASLNPYLITYTSFSLDRGVLEISGKWHVRNDIIQSTNHFLVIDPRVTEKIRKTDTHWIPVPLIMSFILERGNIIDYEIPITGNTKDPEFHFNDVIKDLVGNLFTKASSTPYKMAVKNTDAKTKTSLSLKWAMRQIKLSDSEEIFVNRLADFLKENPQAKIMVHPLYYAEKEKEYILFFEAKKRYFLARRIKRGEAMTEADSLSINKMNPKDPSFVKYLDSYTGDTTIFTIQEKCYRLVDTVVVNRKFSQLVKNREQLFLRYFKRNNTEKQVKLFKYKNTIPFNGFSFFKIDYKGDIPLSVIDAYEKLIEQYDEPARVKYLQFQKDDAGALMQNRDSVLILP